MRLLHFPEEVLHCLFPVCPKGLVFMKKDIKIAFIGGDMRQVFCASRLASEGGYEVVLYGFDKYKGDVGLCTRCANLYDALEISDVVILPLPASTDGINVNSPLSDKNISLEDIFSKVKADKLILYGNKNEKIELLAENTGIDVYDYYDREDYKVANAVPTAEGALSIAITELPVTISGSKCLVIGYGRIGKVLCRLLRALGADVVASARKSEDLMWAKINGCRPLRTDDISLVIGECDIIFNTVPKTILKDELLDLIRPDTLIVDLASKPGGIDFKPAREKGLNVIWALSLPSKTAPKTSGIILSDAIEEILKEKGLV